MSKLDIVTRFCDRVGELDSAGPILPNLKFDFSALVPSEILRSTSDRVNRALCGFVAAEEMAAELLKEGGLWKSYDIERRGHKVIEAIIADFRIRLHWISAEQSLGFHRHPAFDVMGLKKEGYEMDVGGYEKSKNEPPRRIIENLDVRPGDVYLMYPYTWHEVRHRSNSPSVSLSIKFGASNRVPNAPSLSRKELDEKMAQFLSFYEN